MEKYRVFVQTFKHIFLVFHSFFFPPSELLLNLMLSNLGLCSFGVGSCEMWNDVLSSLDEKIWVILPACSTSEEVYYFSWRCYSVLFTLILCVWDFLVIRGRKSLCCYHNCSRGARSLTQNVNPCVMERPSHVPPPPWTIHQRPGFNTGHLESTSRSSSTLEMWRVGVSEEQMDWPLRVEAWKSKEDEWWLWFKPPPLPFAVITTLNQCVYKKYARGFKEHLKVNGKWLHCLFCSLNSVTPFFSFHFLPF